MAKSLKQLKQEWSKLNESEEIKGATSGGTTDYDGVSKTHDEEGGAAKPYGGTTVKNVDSQGKTDGVGNSAPMEFEASNGEGDLSGNTKSVDREAGATAGRGEVGSGDENIGTDAADETAEPTVKENGSGVKEEGSQDAVKDFAGGLGGSLGEFRNKIRTTLGLPLDDQKNQGNKGLNQSGRSDDTKKNLG